MKYIVLQKSLPRCNISNCQCWSNMRINFHANAVYKLFRAIQHGIFWPWALMLENSLPAVYNLMTYQLRTVVNIKRRTIEIKHDSLASFFFSKRCREKAAIVFFSNKSLSLWPGHLAFTTKSPILLCFSQMIRTDPNFYYLLKMAIS